MTMLLWQRWVGSNGDVVVPAVSTQPSTHGGGMDTAVDTAVLSTVWPEGWTQLYSVLYGGGMDTAMDTAVLSTVWPYCTRVAS